jgi:hypothetical protein
MKGWTEPPLLINKKMIICYTDNQIVQSGSGFFTTVPDIKTFNKNHPNATIVHIIPNKQEYTFEKFEEWCMHYGFKPSDYRRQFAVGDDIQELVGFQPKNHKYTCITYSQNTNGYKKATPQFIQKYMFA